MDTHDRGRLSRRALLAGLAALPVSARAEAPETALPPRPGPWRSPAPAPVPAAVPLDRSLSGRTAFALLDLGSGTLLDGHDPDAASVPASVAKVPTALYALEALGPAHRFETRLVAAGELRDGVLAGDLVLVGGGDPVLDTDALAGLAQATLKAGLRRVSGRFLVDGSVLPLVPAIDPDQPVHVAYNPAVAGLNLNFNRVFFEWKPVDGQRRLALEARAERSSPAVARISVEAMARQAPLFTWEAREGREHWTVSEPALGQKGGRWLPVRDPLAYAGEVFRKLAAAAGLDVPEPVAGPAPPGRVIARHESPPLAAILRDMLRHSTNLTAEVTGLAASRARGARAATLAESGRAMSDWLAATLGPAPGESLRNHSGLSGDSRISPRRIAELLAWAERTAPGRLRGLLKAGSLAPADKRDTLPVPNIVAAKTGTLNFVHGLAGYLDGPGGRKLAFAIFAADLAARDRAGPQDFERPAGSRTWIGRARGQELALLRHWLHLHCAG